MMICGGGRGRARAREENVRMRREGGRRFFFLSLGSARARAPAERAGAACGAPPFPSNPHPPLFGRSGYAATLRADHAASAAPTERASPAFFSAVFPACGGVRRALAGPAPRPPATFPSTHRRIDFWHRFGGRLCPQQGQGQGGGQGGPGAAPGGGGRRHGGCGGRRRALSFFQVGCVCPGDQARARAFFAFGGLLAGGLDRLLGGRAQGDRKEWQHKKARRVPQ